MAKWSGGERSGRSGKTADGIIGGAPTSGGVTIGGETFVVSQYGGGGLVSAAYENKAFTGGRLSDGIRPTGKAPRGQGAEYAARRTIANRMDTLQSRISNLERGVQGSKGQRNRRWNDSRSRSLLPQLNSVLSASNSIARGPGPWVAKKELISDLMTTVRGA